MAHLATGVANTAAELEVVKELPFPAPVFGLVAGGIMLFLLFIVSRFNREK